MNKIIEVKNLVKKYGNFSAVDNISFSVIKGEIFGLLGENGAGKTTTMEILEGLRKKTTGNICVLQCNPDKDLAKLKDRIGVQLQSSAYYNFLSLVEILELFGSFYQKRLSPQELLKMVNLESKAKSLVSSLSGGQRQRFSIVAALVNDPEIVFLDEPTTGLDPLARRNLWELITQIKKSGKTIILTTHYMEEAELLCDRVAIMESGKILAIDNTHKLVERLDNPFSVSFFHKKPDQKLLKELRSKTEEDTSFTKEGDYRFLVKDKKILDSAINIVQRIKPESIEVGRARLEDVFIKLTGKNIEEEIEEEK